MADNVLHLDHVTMQFGGVVAVNDLTMDVNEGEIVALIGPNGAGKTTAFNVITGVYAPTMRARPIAPPRIKSPSWALPVPSKISACSAP